MGFIECGVWPRYSTRHELMKTIVIPLTQHRRQERAMQRDSVMISQHVFVTDRWLSNQVGFGWPVGQSSSSDIFVVCCSCARAAAVLQFL